MRSAGGAVVDGPSAPLAPSGCATIVDELFRRAGHSREVTIGAEIEYFTATRAGDRPSHGGLVDLFPAPLPSGGRMTVEPGSQIELSTAPHASVPAMLDALGSDLDLMHRRLAEAQVEHWTAGIDLARRPERTCAAARYRFMERQLDQFSEAGRWMMTNTASLQVNVAHDHDEPIDRWRLLTRLGPLFTAIFANSPGRSADGRCWQSLRQGCWLAMDPRRAGSPPVTGRGPVLDYAAYALAAPVLLVGGETDDQAQAPPPGLTFADWLNQPSGVRPPTEDDFRYHLTTLFPPVRPRGWLEVRCIDALDRPFLDVAVAVVAALCAPEARDDVEAAIVETPGFVAAARDGLRHPVIRASARRLMAIAVEQSRDMSPTVLADMEAFAADFVGVGRSPGDASRVGVASAGHLRPPLDRAGD